MKKLIKDVITKKLNLIPDERGFLMEMLRNDWEEFDQFAQCYVTACYPGVVKAWHYHKKQVDHFICLWGMSKVVLFDPRENSPTKGQINEFHIGIRNPMLIKIPPLVYHGFKSEANETSLIVNIPTELYNYSEPDEYRLPFDDPSIPYNWDIKNG